MSLKNAKRALLAGSVIMVLLIAVCTLTGIEAFGYAGIAAAFISMIVWLVFGRCPSCGRSLGRMSGKYCPYCGEKLEE